MIIALINVTPLIIQGDIFVCFNKKDKLIFKTKRHTFKFKNLLQNSLKKQMISL